ncbi:hypothetical protein BDR26DRAFT_896760 [Obelidium mucronatum]|nr:hypothetical protein BDR26DRAFT_896760 [Obelidium mucronatum]
MTDKNLSTNSIENMENNLKDERIVTYLVDGMNAHLESSRAQADLNESVAMVKEELRKAQVYKNQIEEISRDSGKIGPITDHKKELLRLIKAAEEDYTDTLKMIESERTDLIQNLLHKK